MKEFSAFEFFKQKNTLPTGHYRVLEDDNSISIAIIDEIGNVQWKDIYQYEADQEAECNDSFWANDGIDFILGIDD